MRAWLAMLSLAAASPLSAQAGHQPTFSLDELRHRFADPVSQYAMIDGVEVHYKDEGRGPALLLVHGSSSTMQTWDKVGLLLARHYRVIRYDVPGQGLSGDVSDAVAARVEPAAIAADLLARLGVAHVTAIGVSSGGTLVEYLAASHPDLVERLIVSNAPSDPVDTSHLVLTPEWAKAQADAKAMGQGPAFWSAFLTFFAGDGTRIDMATRTSFAAFNARAPAPNAIALTAKVADHDKAVQAFAAVRAPTLLIWGGSDKLLPPASARILANYLKNTDPSIVYLPDVGHFPPIETPERFARVVETWIEAATPR